MNRPDVAGALQGMYDGKMDFGRCGGPNSDSAQRVQQRGVCNADNHVMAAAGSGLYTSAAARSDDPLCSNTIGLDTSGLA